MERQSMSHVGGKDKDDIVRKSAEYHPSVWGDYFIHNSSLAHEKESIQRMMKRVEELKDQAENLFKETHDILQIMNLVDSIQLLGLDYHFDKEIALALRLIYETDANNYGLYEVSLRFRLLRQHGYYLYADVFNKFKDDKGRFLSALNGDAKGLLSLYNAAYLGTHEEMILDEAISFTKCRLESLLGELEQTFATEVSLSLETPLCRRIRRLLVGKYIPIYQENVMRNDIILELAKLDFNLLQSLHQEEVKKISIWWNDLALNKSLPFARDRVVEIYYWIVAVYFEPQYSRARSITSKAMSLISVMDDIYDNYSTLEESRLLTEAIGRWEPQAVDHVPEYLKDFYLELLKTYKEFEDELEPNEKYRIPYLQEQIKVLSRAYFQEAKWGVEGYVPSSLEDHLSNSLISAGCFAVACASYVGLGEDATKETFEWLASSPKILKSYSILGRLMNDITSHELEQERNHAASTVESYMKEYGTNAKVACEKLQMIVEETWKDLNKECLRPTQVAWSLIEIILNLSRAMGEIYKYNDSYTHSKTRMKDNISLVFVESFTI